MAWRCAMRKGRRDSGQIMLCGGLAGGVFKMGRAEGAGRGLDVVFEQDHCAAAGAAGFGGAAGDGSGGVVEFFQCGGVVVFLDFEGVGSDGLDVAAVGAFEGAGRGVEVEACAAVLAGKFSVCGGGSGHRWGFCFRHRTGRGDRWRGQRRRARCRIHRIPRSHRLAGICRKLDGRYGTSLAHCVLSGNFSAKNLTSEFAIVGHLCTRVAWIMKQATKDQ